MKNDPFASSSLPININVVDCKVIELTPDIVMEKEITFFVGGPDKAFNLPLFT